MWSSETKTCFDLGKHGDSSETRGNKRFPWGMMHPWRECADASTENQKAPELILSQIAGHLANRTTRTSKLPCLPGLDETKYIFILISNPIFNGYLG